MYKDFFGMKNTPFVRGIPVNALYSDNETDEINARLLSAAKSRALPSWLATPVWAKQPPYGECATA